MSIGWIIVSVFTVFVALSMAEITSAHPTSGGPYYWAAMLSPNEELAAFFSWITGWFNFVGQFAVTTGITFGCANLIATLSTVKGGFTPTPGSIIGIYAALLVSHGLVNTFGVHILRYLNNSSTPIRTLQRQWQRWPTTVRDRTVESRRRTSCQAMILEVRTPVSLRLSTQTSSKICRR